MTIPPLPPGFVLEQPQQASGGMPPLPPGFELVQDEIIQSDGVRTGDDGGLEIDIVGGRLQHDDGRLTEEGWNREADLLKYQREADDLSGGAGEFLAGLYASGIDTAQGAYQFAVDSMARPAMLAATAGGDSVIGDVGRLVADPLVSESQRIRQDVAQRRREEEGFSNSLSGGAGRVVGNIAQFVGPGALSRGTVAAGALMPTTITGNALQGAAIGAVQPVVSDSERYGNIALGGGLGAAVPAGIKLASGAGSVASNLASRAGVTRTDRRAADIIRREAANPDALVFQESMVPGVQRTTGEATLDQGLMALEDRVRSSHRGMFGDLDMRNNAARVDQLRRISGTDADMAAAEIYRGELTSGLRDRAFAEGADYSRMSGIMSDLERARLIQQAEDVSSINAAAKAEELDRLSLMADDVRRINSESSFLRDVGGGFRDLPVMSEAEIAKRSSAVPDLPVMTSKEIDEIANRTSRTDLSHLKRTLSGISSSSRGNPAVQSSLGLVRSALDDAGNSIGGLYNVRKYIDALMSGKAGSETTSARAATSQLMSMKEAIDAELSVRAPSFPEYLSAYRSASKPINRMDVGREIIDRSSGAVPDRLGNRTITPAAFSRATNDLDYIAQQATGFKKAKASDILNSEDISMLGAIQDDMSRQMTRLKTPAGNSSTSGRESVGDRIATRSIGSRLPAVGSFFEHFEERATERLTERLAYLMANPAEAKRVLAALPKKDASVVRNVMSQLSMAAGRTSPATVGQDKE